MSDINLGKFRINPRGKFNSITQYIFLDLVNYNGSSYLCINNDSIDGIGCIGILPIGEEQSEKYWMCIADKGDKGDIAPQYDSFYQLDDTLNWDYSKSDKVVLNDDIIIDKAINITNVYDGCVGMIITQKDLILPEKSNISYDYYYIELEEGEYYVYTFVYTELGNDHVYLWNRVAYKKYV